LNVAPLDGVPLQTMKKIAGIDNIQRHGGLLAITKKEFDELSSELNKCLK